MKRGEIAVVVPVFNGESTLARCLSSVLGQTPCPDEVIVVDDGRRGPTSWDRSSFGRIRRLAPLHLLLRGFPYYSSASVVRRDDVLGVGGWDPQFRRCQDSDLALRIGRRFPLHHRDDVEAIVGPPREN